jgi:hypothetical protein
VKAPRRTEALVEAAWAATGRRQKVLQNGGRQKYYICHFFKGNYMTSVIVLENFLALYNWILKYYIYFNWSRIGGYMKIVAGTLFFVLVFVSCGSAPMFQTEKMPDDYLNEVEIIENTYCAVLNVGKKYTTEIKTTDPHLYLSNNNYRTAVKMFETDLKGNKEYSVTIQTISHIWGRTGSVLIPAFEVYDSGKTNVAVKNNSAKAIQPGLIDPVTFKSEFSFYSATKGKYYLSVSGDMTEKIGFKAIIVNDYGVPLAEKDFIRTPYAKFRIKIKEVKKNGNGIPASTA